MKGHPEAWFDILFPAVSDRAMRTMAAVVAILSAGAAGFAFALTPYAVFTHGNVGWVLTFAGWSLVMAAILLLRDALTPDPWEL